jgi:hypothetical protein
MSPRSRKEYWETIFLRYKKATRKEKSKILDEFCATCGCHRKHAIRVLKKFKRFTKAKPKKRGRRADYNAEGIITPLKRIWLAANLPCSKRLKVIIPFFRVMQIHSGPFRRPILCPNPDISRARISEKTYRIL